jgi:hypothetical protein
MFLFFHISFLQCSASPYSTANCECQVCSCAACLPCGSDLTQICGAGGGSTLQ